MYLILALIYFYSIVLGFFFFKQKTAYEMRISDWSSDVCSSDLLLSTIYAHFMHIARCAAAALPACVEADTALTIILPGIFTISATFRPVMIEQIHERLFRFFARPAALEEQRSEEHTSELQSLMRISYAVFCLKKTKNTYNQLHI